MKAPAKLGAFAVALAVVFGGATAVGNSAGPIGFATDAPHDSAHANGGHGAAHGPTTSGAATPGDTDRLTDTGGADSADLPGGLAMSQHGYTLQLGQDALSAGQPATLSLTITGPDGQPVTAYTPTHDKDLHLILVRRDLTGFQHLHPSRDDTGTWTVPVTLPTAGEYRVFADFAPGDSTTAITLGADLSVAGDYSPRPLPAAQRTATVDGGYTVTLDGELVAGQESKLTLTVSKDGQPVTDLQPYLAAYGHLVALRDGDLAYLHVHPDGEPGDGRTPAGPGITFYVSAPTEGDYGLFLDFRHQDTVRTASFTAPATAGDRKTASSGGGHAGHGATTSPTVPVPTAPAEPVPSGAADGGHSSDGHGH